LIYFRKERTNEPKRMIKTVGKMKKVGGKTFSEKVTLHIFYLFLKK